MNKLDLLTFPLEGRNLIEASAGTGKTYTIAALYLRVLIEQRCHPQQILVVTFTKAATHELRERIRELIKQALKYLQQLELKELKANEQETEDIVKQILAKYPQDTLIEIRQHLQDSIIAMDESAIFTIHGFVQRMLAENAFESGNLFDMQLIEDDSKFLQGACNDYWRKLQTSLDNADLDLLTQNWGTPEQLKYEVASILRRSDLAIIPERVTYAAVKREFKELYIHGQRLWNDAAEAISGKIAESLNSGHCKKNYKPELFQLATEELDIFFNSKECSLDIPNNINYYSQSHIAKNILKKYVDQTPEHPFYSICEQLLEQSCLLKSNFKIKMLLDAVDCCRTIFSQLKQDNKVISYDDILHDMQDMLQGKSGVQIATAIRDKYPIAMIDEFQDTDPVQYQVFSKIYPENSNMLMIGDPKQAIYSFRGADIFTYLEAKQSTVSTNQYTLDTNWRSASLLVNAVNTLFENTADPFIFSGIDFNPVKASKNADKTPLKFSGKKKPPLTIWHINITEENLGKSPKGFIKKELAKLDVAHSTANEIANLLQPHNKVKIGDEAIQPADITVLIRDRFQAELIINALAKNGLSCAYQGRDSVFATEQAYEMNIILHALANPNDDSLLVAALTTNIIGKTSDQIVKLQNDSNSWENLSKQVIEFNHMWQSGHFIQMIYQFMHTMQIPAGCLQKSDGERLLTNLLHLIELLQHATKTTHGVNGLINWYQEQLLDTSSSEEQLLRLESDSNLINITTIHRSKGLQYPIVFAPFLWETRSQANCDIVFHKDNKIIRDIGSNDLENNKTIARREELAENIRLLYVALTRAVHKCYISWGKIAGADNSAIGYLLKSGIELKEQQDIDIKENLINLSLKGDKSIEVAQLPIESIFAQQNIELEPNLICRKMVRSIDTTYSVSSFTSLAATVLHLHDNHIKVPVDENKSLESVFGFPKGAKAGLFFHYLFENIDFKQPDSETTDLLIKKALRKYGFDQKWLQVVKESLLNVIVCDLDGNGLSLAAIDDQDRVNEMEFLLKHDRVSSINLNTLLNKFEKYNRRERPLSFTKINGLIKGFVDLTFRHNNKYYIVDYKTNHLGSDLSAYNNDELQQEIRKHDYDLQYLIYTAALHRYLQTIDPDYSYENNFGGVYYLFIRGISIAKSGGVYFDKPPQDLIDELF